MSSTIRKKKLIQNGYSLLEILLVIFIIALFSGISLPYFNASTSTKKLDQEAKQLIDVIELAKAKASAGESNIAGCTIFKGYRVVFDTPPSPPTQYRLRACCASTPAQLCDIPQDIQIYTIQPGMAYTFSANLASPTNYIHFSNLKLGTTLSGNGIIRITNASINKCIRVTVDRIGLVTETPRQTPPC